MKPDHQQTQGGSPPTSPAFQSPLAAVLCASPHSVYHSLPQLDVYDISRDARSFRGGLPVICHPPCRAWSLRLRQQAKPQPGEIELGLWCAEVLKCCGGVLEHPAHSLLFKAAGLPLPGQTVKTLSTVSVRLSWWGFTARKATWLCFAGVRPSELRFPFRLTAQPQEGHGWKTLSRPARAATPLSFALWLVAAARSSTLPTCSSVPTPPEAPNTHTKSILEPPCDIQMSLPPKTP